MCDTWCILCHSSYVYKCLSFYTEQKWKHITTWFQYLVWPNSPTLSRWPRWEWIKCGGGEGVSTIVFRCSNSSHFSPSDMTDCLTLPWACSVLPGQMTVVLHHFCKIKWKRGTNQYVFSLFVIISLSVKKWTWTDFSRCFTQRYTTITIKLFVWPTCTKVIH